MRKPILVTMLIVPLLAIVTYAAECLSFEPLGESYAYSSDDWFGGGSYLGVDTRDITPDRLGPLKLKDERGVEVTMVDQDAPAGKAGLKEHDVILTLNGTDVESVEQLRRMIREIPPGRVITLGLSRDGQPLTLKVQLADRKKTFAMAFSPREFKFEMPARPDIDLPTVVVLHSSMRSGLMVENLTPQLGDFFGVKNGKGVLVRSVDKGSRAEKAGFHAGDVIIRISDEGISDTSDFTRALRSHKNGGSVSVDIVRDKKGQTLTLSLPERKPSGELFEESFEIPDLDAETRIDLSKVQEELARLKPEITLAVQPARTASEEARKELCSRQKELRQQQRGMRKQLLEQQRHLREQQEEMQKELREKLRGSWTEI